MSRREDRSSESKRHRSRFDREPSPKRSRRDGKPEAERPPAEPGVDKDRPDRDHRNHRRLQDPLPLESVNVSRESEKGTDAQKGAAKHSSDQTKVPPSRSFFQHDDRGQNGRGFSRRTDSELGWWRDPNPKEHRNDRSLDTQHKDEKSKDNREVWRHDGYFEMEVNPKPHPRRRPSFREQKLPSDTEKTDRAIHNSVMPSPQDRATDYGRRNNRGRISRYSDRPVAGERESNKAQSWRGNVSSGDRFNGNNNRQSGGDRFTARQGYNPTGGRADKWKHDLYDEANKSPPPKNEEDQISKIESLLAS